MAKRLELPFVDSDREIEASAGMNVTQIFETLGEPAFREGERKVIARLLEGPVCVLSTGGGAFIQPETRALIKTKGISVWLRADFEVLFERVSRKPDNRPLLKKGDPATILRELMEKREKIYAQADLTILSDRGPVETAVERIIEKLNPYLEKQA